RTNTTQTVTYIITPRTAANCVGTNFTLTVTVPPTAEITTMTTVTCSGVPFVVTPTNNTNGIVPDGSFFTWSAPTFTGTVTGGASVSNNPHTVFGSLSNRTNTTQTVTYTVTPLSGNCTGAAFTVIVTLNPTPEVSAMSRVVCNGVLFEISPVNVTNGIVPQSTLYTWLAPTFTASVVGGQPGTAQPFISGTLTNESNIAQEAYYTVTPRLGNCVGANFTITIYLNPTPVITAMSAVTCSGVLFRVTPTNGTNGIVPTGTTYRWNVPTATVTMIGGASATGQSSVFGTLRNTVNTTQTATYVVTPSIANCGDGAPFTVTVTIPPTAEITTMTTVTCSGVPFVVTPTNNTNGIVPDGSFFSWSAPTFTGTVTGGASATENATTVFGLLSNRTNTTQTVTYTVIPKSGNCVGAAFTVIVTLNPTPEVNAMTTVTCSGVPFVVTPTNQTNGIVPINSLYSWSVPTFTGTVTGGASATDNITTIFGNLLNRTNTTQTVTYTVTPRTAAGCVGANFTLTVTLNPTPEVTAMTTVTCSGVPFVVTPSNGTNGIVPIASLYSWGIPTFTGTVTGGASATDNVTTIFGTLRNRTNETQTVTYTVTPRTAAGCVGTNFTLTVTLPPTAEITTMTTVTCSGVPFVVTPTNVTNGIVPNGSVYSWSVPTFTGTVTGGASASNYPTIVFGNLLNRTNTTQTVTYTVTPLSGNCTGAAFTVIVTLNPTPEVTAMTTVTCSGVPFVVTPSNGTNGIVPIASLYSWGIPTFTGTVT
ncbi:MAG: PKD-like domain-containing protein, partial [Pseudomonadota bacterium]